jgi:heme O synthase-like polyprenyltransferase
MLGVFYFLAATVLGVLMIRMALRLIRVADKAAARRMYKYSTAYLAFLFLAMIVDRIL